VLGTRGARRFRLGVAACALVVVTVLAWRARREEVDVEEAPAAVRAEGMLPPLASVSVRAGTHRAVVETFLAEGSVDVYLDPRRPGVVVPGHLRTGPRLILQFGRTRKVPIPDLRVSDDGISGTLSFDGGAFACTIPWTAVFAAFGVGDLQYVWPENIPDELRDGGAKDASRSDAR
jgi:hypothetical protein